MLQPLIPLDVYATASFTKDLGMHQIIKEFSISHKNHSLEFGFNGVFLFLFFVTYSVYVGNYLKFYFELILGDVLGVLRFESSKTIISLNSNKNSSLSSFHGYSL